MTITCPQCAFSKEVDPESIPPGTPVNCPVCGNNFTPRSEEEELEFTPLSPRPEVPAPPTPAELPKGGFGVRAAAFLLDGVIVSLTQYVLVSALLRLTGLGDAYPSPDPLAEIISHLFGLTLMVAYYVFFIGYSGQTVGKMALRLKVIRTDGTPVGYGRAFLREIVGKFLSGLLLGIGYLMVLFDRQKQGLHDKIADTYVIRI